MGRGDPGPAPGVVRGEAHGSLWPGSARSSDAGVQRHPPALGNGWSVKGCARAIVAPSKPGDFSMRGGKGEAPWAQAGRYILRGDAFICLRKGSKSM